MSKRSPYPAFLDKPLRRRLDALLRTPVYFRGRPDEWRSRLVEASLADAIDFGTCWLQLLRHYGIDLTKWDGPSELELAMASQHVPAFQEPRRSIAECDRERCYQAECIHVCRGLRHLPD